MKTLINAFIIWLFLSSCNLVKSQYVFDKIPLDTSKWIATDTIFLDFNNDGIKDAILVFDKYKALYRPNNVQTPVLFYLGVNSKYLNYIDKSEKLICLPSFDIKALNNTLLITQKGIHDDRNIYSIYLKYVKGEIVLFKEVVIRIIKKSKINEETGDVTTSVLRQDTIYNQAKIIPLAQYDFLEFISKVGNDK